MSLINDALRRAKKAHQETSAPPPPAPSFRPVEPLPPAARGGLGLLAPITLVMVVLLGLLLFWQWSKKEGSSTAPTGGAQLNVSARTPTPEVTAQPTEVPGSPTPAPNASVSAKGVAGNIAEAKPAVSEHSARGSISSNTNLPAVLVETGASNRVAAPEPAPPAPAPLKLQGIVYNPRRPSAMINGHVMFVGDRIRDLRILAIRADTVLLVGGGRTNLLSLEP
jgi:hypothetical protein